MIFACPTSLEAHWTRCSLASLGRVLIDEAASGPKHANRVGVREVAVPLSLEQTRQPFASSDAQFFPSRRKAVEWNSTIGISAAAALAIFSVASSAGSQQQSLQELLVGTWTLVSHESERADGSKFSMYGSGPKGVAFFDAGGRFIIAVARSERARYEIDNPMQGTAEENKATAQGAMTYFGTYSVNEPDRIIYIHIDASSFPNCSGTDQQRSFTISQDQLKLTARALQTGGQAEVIWQRAK